MSLKLRLFMAGWSLLWTLLLPLVLGYLWYRGQKDVLYRQKLGERFGRFRKNSLAGSVWIHAVSLGEVRSAVPLVRELLARGERIVVTHFTPAGRRETERVFGTDIAEGRLASVWVPFEINWAYRGFFRTFQPSFGLVMEIEIWPCMVTASRRAGIPLFMCNAQYPTKSMTRDARGFGLRREIMRQFAGAFVKSRMHAERFAQAGVSVSGVTGELRFDQPVPGAFPKAGVAAREWLGATNRPVIVCASVVKGEDAIYLDVIRELQIRLSPKPLIVYVPRSPERFDETEVFLRNAGLCVLRRSRVFPDGLDPAAWPAPPADTPDILLGDSLGEMYFYLAIGDRAIVGGGFTPYGAHNIIEPLALGKAVVTGPEIGTIEYPFLEAEASGIAIRVETADAMAETLISGSVPNRELIDTFIAEHSGCTERLLRALPQALDRARPQFRA